VSRLGLDLGTDETIETDQPASCARLLTVGPAYSDLERGQWSRLRVIDQHADDPRPMILPTHDRIAAGHPARMGLGQAEGHVRPEGDQGPRAQGLLGLLPFGQQTSDLTSMTIDELIETKEQLGRQPMAAAALGPANPGALRIDLDHQTDSLEVLAEPDQIPDRQRA
jgi:hypothetical protein